MHRWSAWTIAAASLLAAVFVFECYRAATQSISFDEARAYLLFIAPQDGSIFHSYDASHHVLQTYLSWMAARLLGASELSLRLPSLLGCALYLAFVFRFCRLLFDSRAGMLAGPAVLALHPLVLDHFAIARGYGLALGFFAWALLLAFEKAAGAAIATSRLESCWV